MALICCPECSTSISDTAESCPICGFKLTAECVALQRQKEKRQKEKSEKEAAEYVGYWITGGFAVFVLCCLGLCSGTLGNRSSTVRQPAYQTTQPSYPTYQSDRRVPAQTSYSSPPSSDSEFLRRLQEQARQGATWDDIGDRMGFSPSQKASFERGRQQGLRDLSDR